MSKDFRIETSLSTHPKTVKLIRRCGYEGFFSLISLWGWVTLERPEGDLSGMDAEDIEIAAQWEGQEGLFVKTLTEVKFLDNNGEKDWSLHDWAEHNPWAYAAVERGNKSRLSRMAKTHPSIYEKIKNTGAEGISKKEYISLTLNQRTVNEPLTNGQADVNEPLTSEQRTVNEPVSPAPTPVPPPTPVVNLEGKPSLSKVTPLDEELAEYLAMRIKENYPDAKCDQKKWADIIRLMRTRDKRTENGIRKVIDFATNDSFWMGNILSASSLRKQYDKLWIKTSQNKTQAFAGQGSLQNMLRGAI